MTGRPYLLDTSVLMALIRGDTLGEYIDAKYGLRAAKQRPLISIVTHGEIQVLAGRNKWGAKKSAALTSALQALVTVDINHPDVLAAYVEIELFSQSHSDGARNMGKNDLWIAATAKAADSILLTTDKDFDHLQPSVLSVEYIEPNPAKWQ